MLPFYEYQSHFIIERRTYSAVYALTRCPFVRLYLCDIRSNERLRSASRHVHDYSINTKNYIRRLPDSAFTVAAPSA